MQTFKFRLHISCESYLKVYKGLAQTIRVVAEDGRTVEFPARNVQTFLQRDGIHGYFELVVSDQAKFVSIRKID